MGTSVHITLDYKSIEKPFQLRGRVHDLGGTDYWTITRLTLDEAQLLHRYGVPWWDKAPDLMELHRRLSLMEAERDKRKAEERIAALTHTPHQ
jgi:hypothetical protein